MSGTAAKKLREYFAVVLIVAATAAPALAQTDPPGAPALPSYFVEAGLSYDYYGRVPAETTGFGLRIGASNAFSVTDIDAAIAQAGTTCATLRTGLEYHLSVSGRWEFIGLGSVGATTNGSTTTANFTGGVAVSYDLGNLLSKGKVNLPAVFQYRITVITATQVKPTYGVEFRKTFK